MNRREFGRLGRRSHNPGLRMAPHFFNTMGEIERTVAAVRRYAASSV